MPARYFSSSPSCLFKAAASRGWQRMTRSQIRDFVDTSSVERIREVLDLLQKLKNHVPPSQLPHSDAAFLIDLRDHEEFFRTLADEKLRS